jgi:antitoxin component YwqK of YwqJK toxin-antitoxin module
MKNIILILTAVFIVSSTSLNGQQSPQTAKVKSITVYEEKFDKLVSQKYKESETTYDEKGNILEDILYKDGKVDKHFKYQYDANSNKIKETEYNPAGNIEEYSEYKYEKNLRVEKTVFDPRGKVKSKKAYIYTTY